MLNSSKQRETRTNSLWRSKIIRRNNKHKKKNVKKKQPENVEKNYVVDVYIVVDASSHNLHINIYLSRSCTETNESNKKRKKHRD